MKLLDVIDPILESMVALSYTSLGYRVRKRLWKEEEHRLDGCVVLITGANAGLGRAATQALARRGARVIMACRNGEKAEAARSAILDAVPQARLDVELVDVSEMESVRACAARVRGSFERLDVLVHNAGVMLDRPEVNSAGIEKTLATNVLGGFVLTRELLPLLEASAPSRIIHVTSGGMYTQKLEVDDLQGEHTTYDGVVRYAQTKRAQVILNEMWAKRLEGRGVSSFAMHPGWADTPGVERSLPRFHKLLKPILRSPDEGADTIVWLASEPELENRSGALFFDRRARRTHVLPNTRIRDEERSQLWSELEALATTDLATAGDSP